VFENSLRPGEIVRRSYPFIPPPAVPPVLIVKRHNSVAQSDPELLPAGRKWILAAHPDLRITPLHPGDKCCHILPWPLDSVQSSRYVGLTVEATRPFKVDVKVFSNLGQFVNEVTFSVDEAHFRRLPQGSLDSSRVMKILWDNRTAEGGLAGTGAYVMKSHVALTQGGLSNRRIQMVGVLRKR
jgi:hypothetical protein